MYNISSQTISNNNDNYLLKDYYSTNIAIGGARDNSYCFDYISTYNISLFNIYLSLFINKSEPAVALLVEVAERPRRDEISLGIVCRAGLAIPITP